MAMGTDCAEHLARARAAIVSAAQEGAQVICLPELFRSRYFCQIEDPHAFDLAESVPGPTTEAVGALAAELGVAIIATVFERRAAGLYHNSAVVLDPAGRIAGHYRKMHIPDDPGYYEKYYFAPGDLGFATVPTPFGSLGVLICWDQWYPEAARLAALAGAEVLFYPTAIGWHPREKNLLGAEQREAWFTIQRAHAIANGVFVAAVNRTGHEPHPRGEGEGIEFWGSSFVCGPFGSILAEASVDREEVLVQTLDLEAIERQRRCWPFLRDRRIDAFRPLAQRMIGSASSSSTSGII